MKVEFPSDDETIECEAIFTTPMKSLCGNSYTIESLTDNRVYFTKDVNFHISTDMLEAFKKQKPATDIPQTILIVPLVSNSINNALSNGYTIREFHNDKCIMELKKSYLLQVEKA